MTGRGSNHTVPVDDDTANPGLMLLGGLGLVLVGGLFVLGADGSGGALFLGWLLSLLGSVLLLIGCVAVGVEIGVRRARVGERARERSQA
jgi:hypothetical protein